MIFLVKTDHPIATDSPDHLMPRGTRWDSYRHPRFLTKIERLPLASSADFGVLDLGCAGGGFIKECVDRGWYAAGLEGSDYSKKRGRAEWGTIPSALFTCDIAKPFTVSDAATHAPAQFSIVTAWEVLEHIAERDLETLFDNVLRHLRADGLFIVSICPSPSVWNGFTLHQTVRPRSWWEATLLSSGLFPQSAFLDYFAGQYVRGPKFYAWDSFTSCCHATNAIRSPPHHAR